MTDQTTKTEATDLHECSWPTCGCDSQGIDSPVCRADHANDLIEKATLNEAQTDAYAEGRKDQAEEDGELLRWAYSKLHHINFTKQDDALMLDRFKLLLEHGIAA